MILVDTSVLIDYFKGIDSPSVQTFDQILYMNLPYGINHHIYQEILQGSRTVKEFHQLKNYLETIPFYDLLHGKESYESAAYLYFLCRRNGITIRNTIDLIIAETAIENNLYLLHNDTDFFNISKIICELKIYDVLED